MSLMEAFQELFRLHPIPMWIYDLETLAFIEVNEAACRNYGYDRETFLSLNLRDIRPPEDIALLEENVAKGREPFQNSGTWCHWTRTRQILQVEITSHHLRFDGREAVLVMARDVSARHQEEQELQRSLVRLTQAQGLAGLGLWDLDLLTDQLNWSWEGVETGSVQEHQPIRCLEDFFARVHPEDRGYVRAGFLIGHRGEAKLDLEHRFFLHPGDERVIHLSAEVMRDTHGRPVQLLGIVQDITERKNAEEILRSSELRLRTLVENAPLAILVMRQGAIIYVNSRAMEMFGLVDSEAQVGRSILNYFAQQGHQENLERTIRLLPEGQAPFEFEARGVRADGSDFPMFVAVAPIQLPNGTANVAFMRDLSEHYQAVAQQQNLQLQLMRSQKTESLGTLAGGVAHDMNNVLGAILSIASLQQSQAQDGTLLRSNMDTIVKACLRGRSMVQGLLGFARRELAEGRLLDMNVLVGETVDLLKHTMPKQIGLELDLTEGLRPILGDPSALSHALMNLCLNSVDAMPAGGLLTLRTRNDEAASILLEVRDSGIGMSNEVLDKALDPFFTTKPQGKGTGLGLALVYGVVKAHQGQMDLWSSPGKGTVVSIRLPASAVEPEAEPDASPEAQVPSAAKRLLRVLVVDDDELLQESTRELLKFMGHVPTVAGSGEEALARLQEGLPCDVVLLDLNMPGLGGAATLPRIRSQNPELPILLATGRADQAALDLITAHPGVRLLSKPYMLKDLRKHLEELG